MKNLFKTFLVAVLLVSVSWAALAAWNIKQNDDGTTDWIRESNGTTVQVPVGNMVLTVLLENVSSASTTAIAIPLTNMRVSYIQSVMLGDITTADAIVDFYNGNSDGAIQGKITDSNNGLMTITAVAGDEIGDVDTFTPTKTDAANFLGKDSVIFVHVDGGSTNDVDAVITITLEPR